MEEGDIVLVSDFVGDIYIIGVEAIFIGMSDAGKFITKPITPGKYKKDFNEWKYCVPFPDDEDY